MGNTPTGSASGVTVAARGGAAATAPVASASAEDRVPDPSSRLAPAKVTTAFAQGAGGIIQFHVDVKVDMAEFATWPADRIAAFFAGMAQVLAAKAGVEEAAAGET